MKWNRFFKVGSLTINLTKIRLFSRSNLNECLGNKKFFKKMAKKYLTVSFPYPLCNWIPLQIIIIQRLDCIDILFKVQYQSSIGMCLVKLQLRNLTEIETPQPWNCYCLVKKKKTFLRDEKKAVGYISLGWLGGQLGIE